MARRKLHTTVTEQQTTTKHLSCTSGTTCLEVTKVTAALAHEEVAPTAAC